MIAVRVTEGDEFPIVVGPGRRAANIKVGEIADGTVELVSDIMVGANDGAGSADSYHPGGLWVLTSDDAPLVELHVVAVEDDAAWLMPTPPYGPLLHHAHTQIGEARLLVQRAEASLAAQRWQMRLVAIAAAFAGYLLGNLVGRL